LVYTQTRTKKPRKPCKWEKSSKLNANLNEWQCMVCGQYGYGTNIKAPFSCVKDLDSGPFKHFEPSLRERSVERSDRIKNEKSEHPRDQVLKSPSRIVKEANPEQGTLRFLSKHFVMFIVVFLAVFFALVLSRFIFSNELNFEQFLVSIDDSKNVVIFALIEFLFELGEGFCRVAYENEVTFVTDNLTCSRDTYFKLGLGTTVGIIIAVYVMVKFRTYVIFNNF
jgi:hypothetical protein